MGAFNSFVCLLLTALIVKDWLDSYGLLQSPLRGVNSPLKSLDWTSCLSSDLHRAFYLVRHKTKQTACIYGIVCLEHTPASNAVINTKCGHQLFFVLICFSPLGRCKKTILLWIQLWPKWSSQFAFGLMWTGLLRGCAGRWVCVDIPTKRPTLKAFILYDT